MFKAALLIFDARTTRNRVGSLRAYHGEGL